VPETDPRTDLERKPEWRATGIVFFAIVAIALLYAAFMIVWPFLTAIIIGAIVVTLTYPIFRRLRTRFKENSNRAAIVMLIGITFILVIPALLLTGLLVQQANGLVDKLQSVDAQQMIERLDVAHRLAFVQRYVPSFDPAQLSPQRLLLPAMRQIPGWMAKHGSAVLGGIAGLVLGFFLMLLASYFFYVEGESILDQLAILSPLPEKYDREFASRFKDVIDATFRGQVFTAIAQGFATGVGLAIAGVPGAVFWGAVAALMSLLPMVGAATVWVPASIYLFISASMGARGYFGPIFLTAWGVLVVSLIDNVVRPWAMRGKAQLPAIPLLFAVIGGMQAFGFVGLVIGPLVFSLLMAIIEIYRTTFSTRKAVPG